MKAYGGVEVEVSVQLHSIAAYPRGNRPPVPVG
jgi:hypothetical protein